MQLRNLCNYAPGVGAGFAVAAPSSGGCREAEWGDGIAPLW